MVDLFRGMDIYIKGEMSKALPVSPKRMRSLSVSDDDLLIELMGTPSEAVDFEVCQLTNDHSICVVFPCVISDGGSARLSLTLGPKHCR